MKHRIWNLAIIAAMAGTMLIVVGLLLGVVDVGENILSFIFGTGLVTLALSLTVAFAAKTNFARIALLAGLLGASGGIAVGFFVVTLMVVSLVALVGAGLATQAPKFSIPLMFLPAIIGSIADPYLFWIPATLLIGASLLVFLHLLISEHSTQEGTGSDLTQRPVGDQ